MVTLIVSYSLRVGFILRTAASTTRRWSERITGMLMMASVSVQKLLDERHPRS